jgi:hypothetical protein
MCDAKRLNSINLSCCWCVQFSVWRRSSWVIVAKHAKVPYGEWSLTYTYTAVPKDTYGTPSKYVSLKIGYQKSHRLSSFLPSKWQVRGPLKRSLEQTRHWRWLSSFKGTDSWGVASLIQYL